MFTKYICLVLILIISVPQIICVFDTVDVESKLFILFFKDSTKVQGW